MSDLEEGQLDPAVAARLEQIVIGHRLDRAEVDEAIAYRDQVVALAGERMRRNRCSERETAAMVSGALETPYAAWIRAMRGPGDFGLWDN